MALHASPVGREHVQWVRRKVARRNPGDRDLPGRGVATCPENRGAIDQHLHEVDDVAPGASSPMHERFDERSPSRVARKSVT